MISMLGGHAQTGYSPHYRPGLMAQVAHHRGLPVAACMVSSPTLAIGQWVYIYSPTTGALRSCEIVDISAPRDRARHLRTHRIAELDYASAQALCPTIAGRSQDCPIIEVSQ